MSNSYLEEVLPHACCRLRCSTGGLVNDNTVQGVLLSWVALSKCQLGDGMAQVKVLVCEGDQVMDMHVALLVGLARSKVYVASYLQAAKSTTSSLQCSLMTGPRSKMALSLTGPGHWYGCSSVVEVLLPCGTRALMVMRLQQWSCKLMKCS